MAGHYVYIIAETGAGQPYCKIGVSGNPGARLLDLATGNPRLLRLVHCWKFARRQDAFDVERIALDSARAVKAHNEWIEAGPDEAMALVLDAVAVWQGNELGASDAA